jgi:hypothetical protein
MSKTIIKERELKMVKKSLFLIALTILVSTNMLAAQVEGPVPQFNGTLKTDIDWPYEKIVTIEYIIPESDLCVMDIEIKVGWYIEIINCDKTIVLEQVQCSDIVSRGFGNSIRPFPCYADCQEIGINSNFDATLGLRLEKDGPYQDVITETSSWWGTTVNWQAYFSPVDFDDPDFNTAGFEVSDTYDLDIDTAAPETKWVFVCVEAWDANLWIMPPGTQGKVGTLTITVQPTEEALGL